MGLSAPIFGADSTPLQENQQSHRSLGVVSLDGYSTTPRWDSAASLRSRFNSGLSAQRIHRLLRGRLAGVEPSPTRPVGELAGGHRDLLGQLRQPPLVRPELVGVRLLVRQAAARQQLADEFGGELAAPLRRDESLPVQASAICAAVWPS